MQQPRWPRAGVSGILPGRPLVAKFEIEMPSALRDSSAWISAIYRSADGSIRTDLTTASETYVIILDAGGRQVVFHQSAGTAYIWNLKIGGSEPMWGFHAKPEQTNDNREILGVTCNRVSFTGQSVGELWMARDLGVVLLDTETLPEGHVVWRAISVKAEQPEPSLFAIPKNVREIVVRDPEDGKAAGIP